jgi:hypothetical protein
MDLSELIRERLRAARAGGGTNVAAAVNVNGDGHTVGVYNDGEVTIIHRDGETRIIHHDEEKEER